MGTLESRSKLVVMTRPSANFPETCRKPMVLSSPSVPSHLVLIPRVAGLFHHQGPLQGIGRRENQHPG